MKSSPFYIIGNWKSNKTVTEAVQWFQDVQTLWKKTAIDTRKVRIILCPASIHLTTLSSLITLSNLPIMLGCQDISAFSTGAYTGDIAASMVKGLVKYSLIGHSERRKYHREDEAILTEKITQAREVGIEPVYCIQTDQMALHEKCTFVAYEPVWAIGTGKPDTPENANQVAQKIKKGSGDQVTVIYGGSVTAENVGTYVRTEHIGGVLPGGASLKPDSFMELISNAANA